ncbi:hypothetical protein BDV93DRAFT_513035 [Ceratobasidium sp. AG-I]|nr:hypothetical protein BDV93DRAFT_513035 [Ceratobasidium sp. AG-I]
MSDSNHSTWTQRFFVPAAVEVDTPLKPFINFSGPHACVEVIQKWSKSIDFNLPNTLDDLETFGNNRGPAGQMHGAEDKKLPNINMHHDSEGDIDNTVKKRGSVSGWWAESFGTWKDLGREGYATVILATDFLPSLDLHLHPTHDFYAPLIYSVNQDDQRPTSNAVACNECQATLAGSSMTPTSVATNYKSSLLVIRWARRHLASNQLGYSPVFALTVLITCPKRHSQIHRMGEPAGQ